jgi:hypothetical protein
LILCHAAAYRAERRVASQYYAIFL